MLLSAIFRSTGRRCDSGLQRKILCTVVANQCPSDRRYYGGKRRCDYRITQAMELAP
jgi:hypothetical protein